MYISLWLPQKHLKFTVCCTGNWLFFRDLSNAPCDIWIRFFTYKIILRFWDFLFASLARRATKFHQTLAYFFSPTLPPFNKTLHNGHKNITTFLQFSWSQRHSSLIFLTSNSLFYDIPKGTSFFSSECSIPPAVNYWLTGEFNPTIRLIFLSLARISIYRFFSFLLWTEINVIFYPKTSFNSSFLSVFFLALCSCIK